MLARNFIGLLSRQARVCKSYRDSDGFIDRHDIKTIKRELLEYVVQSQGRVIKEGYGIGFDGYWLLFTAMADTNHDGKISRDEWLAMWEKVSEQARDTSFSSLPQWIRLMPSCLFPVIDTTGDGVIDLEEYSNFWFHLGKAENPARTVLAKYFNHLTKDDKHKITLSRFEELYADFYLSKDPNTPGKYIAGPIDFNQE